MKRVLVTGASGFVGGHVVEALAHRGVPTRCLVRKTSRLDFIREWSPELAFGDVTAPASLESALDGADAVVHCAGITRAVRPADFMRVNAEGCENLYRACLAAKPPPRRIVYVGSLAALGPSAEGRPVDEVRAREPVSDYGRSKLAGHRVAESYADRLPIVILIPPAVYGPGDKDFLRLFRMVRGGVFVTVGRRPRWLSLIYARDLAAAAVVCLQNNAAVGRQYLVDDGTPRTWDDIATAVAHAAGRSPMRLRIPPCAAIAWAGLAEAGARCLGKATLLTRDKMREILQPAWACSSARIRAELGFAPRYSLEQGVEETYRWYLEHGWL